ncbi:MAG: dihydrofolate reductase [Methylocystis sp.]|jgi:dihydrofolate reductase
MPPQLVAVVAVARNGVIGAENGLPWRVSSDLKRFKSLTMGKPLILGRRTFESLPQPLPGRRIVVLTRDLGFSRDGVLIAHDPAEALDLARHAAEAMLTKEIIVGGGTEIFRLYLPQTQRIELTEIALEPEGDAFLPEIDMSQWQEISRQNPPRGQRDEADFAFVTLERRKN